jgi:tRNA-intron endonuclease
LSVYHNLKSSGLIVKTGFKYGAHFRVYEGDPETDHSEYLVHGVPFDFESDWEEISRAVRLAHGVRKKMLFGRDHHKKNKIQYINIERIKP